MKRVFGRTTDVLTGKKTWVEVTTDRAGYNDAVYVTALAQCLLMNTGESPFFGNWGIPAHQSVQSQTSPDYHVALMQTRYSQFFASLIITKSPTTFTRTTESPPTYDVRIMCHSGAFISFSLPVI